ncbi:MAG: 50S ribosomal protein L32 [Patescibacteria group bacterium]
MSVPKKRQNKRRKGMRASHMGLTKTDVGTCSKCKKPVRPHIVCQNCGFYKGKDILKLESKLTKKELKKKQKADAKAEQADPTKLDEMGNPIK